MKIDPWQIWQITIFVRKSDTPKSGLSSCPHAFPYSPPLKWHNFWHVLQPRCSSFAPAEASNAPAPGPPKAQSVRCAGAPAANAQLAVGNGWKWPIYRWFILRNDNFSRAKLVYQRVSTKQLVPLWNLSHAFATLFETHRRFIFRTISLAGPEMQTLSTVPGLEQMLMNFTCWECSKCKVSRSADLRLSRHKINLEYAGNGTFLRACVAGSFRASLVP